MGAYRGVMLRGYSLKILRFAVVGSIGFIIDAIAMFLFSFYIAAIPARALSFWTAATSNWWLNRHLTFRSANSPKALQQWLRFIAVSCIGFIPSWGCYWLLMQFIDIEQYYQLALIQALPIDHLTIETAWPFIAMVPGVLLGMLSNYLLAERWVFKALTG